MLIWVVSACNAGGPGAGGPSVTVGGLPGDGSVNGVPIPTRDGQGRPRPDEPPLDRPEAMPRVADGMVSGKIKAPDGSEFESVMVELVEAPRRVLRRVRAQVNESYRIPYSSGEVRCIDLAVRFIAAEMTTPYVRHLGRCGRHVVNYELPR